MCTHEASHCVPAACVRYSSEAPSDYDFALLELDKPMPINECIGLACLPSEEDTWPGVQHNWLGGSSNRTTTKRFAGGLSDHTHKWAVYPEICRTKLQHHSFHALCFWSLGVRHHRCLSRRQWRANGLLGERFLRRSWRHVLGLGLCLALSRRLCSCLPSLGLDLQHHGFQWLGQLGHRQNSPKPIMSSLDLGMRH